MTLVSLEKIARHFGDLAVLDGLGMRVDESDRIGVIGDNGAGKTTMLQILAGLDEADSGTRNCKKGIRIAYGAQMPDAPSGVTVLDHVIRGTGEHDALEEQMRHLEAQLAEGNESALREYGDLQAAFEAGGGYEHDHQVEKVLDGLGFTAQDRQKDVSSLSGGELSRLQLAVLMTTPADLLILDEPTNHLDLYGIEFIEEYVRRYPGAVVLVSHDRMFLDNVATSILDVNYGVATRFKGNFSQYAEQRDQKLLSEARQYKNQREFVDKELDYIRRHMAGQNSAQAKGRLKRLQRLQLIDKPKGNRSSMKLKFEGGKGLKGQTVMEGEQLTIAAGGKELIANGAFRVQFGEVIALLGRNGSGKTTLLKHMAGQLVPATGQIHKAQNLRVGYFSQDKRDLPTSGTVLEALRELDTTVEERELRDHLALFLFCGDDVEKPITELSGGEKQRLSLARLIRAQFDLLCMDEPTNHLDVSGTEGLEQALKEFPGTIILITHDRRLASQLADRVVWLEGCAIRQFESGLDQCMQHLAAERSAARQAQVEAREKAAKKAAKNTEPTARASAAETGKIRNPLMFKKLEERIITLEEQIEGVRSAMLDPDNYSSSGKMQTLQAEEKQLVAELAEAYEQWEKW